MKNPLKPKYIPYLVLTAGVATLLLRVWLFATGMDHRGLLRTEHPANALTFILLALTLAALYLCLRPVDKTHKLLFPKSILAGVGSVAAGLGLLYTVLTELADKQEKITILCCVLGGLSAISLLISGFCRFRGRPTNLLLHGILGVYLMVHLIYQYRFWSAEPQLQKYFFQLLAAIFLMLTAYHRSSLDHQSSGGHWFVFFNYGSVFLCLCALPCNDWPFYLALGLWCATCDCSLSPAGKTMKLPQDVSYCLRKLQDAGFEAYVVGGCVRDSLLGLIPQDYDMCTSATPEETARVFAEHNLVKAGEKHGTIGVVFDKQVYEITTFRTEGTYSDNRHPDSVAFVTDLEQDLSRRDFTVNAMAYSPEKGYIDLFGGEADLENRVLRTVGDPEKRFTEDALRILRGVRFAVRFDLTAEKNTKKAMTELAPLMDKLAKERVFSELCKLMLHINAQQLLDFSPIITQIIPELAPTLGFDQHSPHHAYDVFTHTAYTVAALPAELPLRLAGLLHDIGKPVVFSQDENGRGHFYDHAQVGAKMTDDILLRLRASTALREQVVLLIAQHMTPLEPDKKLLRRRLGKLGEETVLQILALQKADFGSKGVIAEKDWELDRVEAMLSEIRQEDACLTVKDLAITGTDLLSLGADPSPLVGQCMDYLLEQVQNETLANTREELLSAAKTFFETN